MGSLCAKGMKASLTPISWTLVHNPLVMKYIIAT